MSEQEDVLFTAEWIMQEFLAENDKEDTDERRD